MKKIFWTFFFLSTIATQGRATELDPWFHDPLLLITRGNFTYAYFHKIAAEDGKLLYKSHDLFLDRSLEMTLNPSWDVELEWQGAHTKKTSWGVEFIRATGRYLILDDVGAIDPVSMAVGLTMTFPWQYRLFDPSLMHHSQWDSELHLSIGKEFSSGPYWTEHLWGLIGFGQGIEGSPWIHGILAAERNFKDKHRFKLELDYLQGLGNRSITVLCPFPGYAQMNHISLDATFSYHLTIPTWCEIHLEYYHRLAARNCPFDIQGATIGIVWPLTLDSFAF